MTTGLQRVLVSSDFSTKTLYAPTISLTPSFDKL